MATNPIDPNFTRGPQLHKPEPRAEIETKKPFPWGVIGALITAAILGLIIWYFVAGAPGR
ncbi:MAG TPA: hypothetical protein VE998_02865 [Terriglobales bacterium]|nr:hypothetical protein [Terriglobales bacterium]